MDRTSAKARVTSVHFQQGKEALRLDELNARFVKQLAYAKAIFSQSPFRK